MDEIDENKDLITRSLQVGEQIAGDEYCRIFDALQDALAAGYEAMRAKFSFSAHDPTPATDPAMVHTYACWMRVRDLLGAAIVTLTVVAIKVEENPAYVVHVQDRDVDTLVTAAEHLIEMQTYLNDVGLAPQPGPTPSSTVN